MTARARATSRNAFTRYGFYIWVGVLVVLVGQALYSFARQQIDGHNITGLTDTTPWGLYIVGFVFFVGASAGSTVIGLMVHAFGRKDYERLATRAILVGFLSLVAAVTFIVVDVGRTERMFLLPWYWHNPTSMFFYTSITYYLFAAILLAELYYTVKLTRGSTDARDRSMAKWLAIIAVPFALGVVHAPHGALFAIVKARAFWNNPLLPPHFAVVALVSGTALMALVAIATSWLERRELVGTSTLGHMAGLLAFFIVLAGFFDFFDWIVFAYSDKAEGVIAWDILFGSNVVPSLIQIVGYLVAFVFLLFLLTRWRERLVPALAAAAVIALVAVVAYRSNLVTVDEQPVPLLPFSPRDQVLGSNVVLSVLHVAGYFVALVLLLYALARRREWLVPALAAASAITLVAVAAYRFNLVTVGQAVPLAPFIPRDQYWPTWTEISIAAGIVALIGLSYSILTRALPLEDDAPAHSDVRVVAGGGFAPAGGAS